MARLTSVSVNVGEAKRRFSDLLARVAYGGETVLVTRRGRPMAKLVPAREPGAASLADVRGWLEADDPYLKVVDGIVAGRAQHRPRVASGVRRRAARR
ncbi:MAG TPA: type II toxin-antitoxin system Phd/YefM family antitoxin [Vicinamibacteria bacterium]|nr:type II toxin-antitoxin system Phd/YefM family antitoxin [Vicinamibacteria bacterium]